MFIILTFQSKLMAGINKMRSTRSIDLDQVVYLMWNFRVTATHIPVIFNMEADIESRKHETIT